MEENPWEAKAEDDMLQRCQILTPIFLRSGQKVLRRSADG